ncbi:MAG TPA: hypothetical protein VGF69_09800 [Thermoanaerobaculia bacterium]|jgi:hypothetical protein
MKVKALRTLVVIDWAMVVFGFGLYELSVRSLPVPLRAFIAAQDAAPQSPLVKALLYVGIGLWCIATVGIMRVRPAGRLLYVPSLIVLLAAVSLGGPKSVTGWFSVFEQLSALVDGAIVALLYTTREFEPAPPTPL